MTWTLAAVNAGPTSISVPTTFPPASQRNTTRPGWPPDSRTWPVRRPAGAHTPVWQQSSGAPNALAARIGHRQPRARRRRDARPKANAGLAHRVRPPSRQRCASRCPRRSGVVIGHTGCPRLPRLRASPCACCRPDPRRPASAPSSRSRGRAATPVDADLAAGPDEQQERWLDDGCPTYAYTSAPGPAHMRTRRTGRAPATTPLPLSMRCGWGAGCDGALNRRIAPVAARGLGGWDVNAFALGRSRRAPAPPPGTGPPDVRTLESHISGTASRPKERCRERARRASDPQSVRSELRPGAPASAAHARRVLRVCPVRPRGARPGSSALFAGLRESASRRRSGGHRCDRCDSRVRRRQDRRSVGRWLSDLFRGLVGAGRLCSRRRTRVGPRARRAPARRGQPPHRLPRLHGRPPRATRPRAGSRAERETGQWSESEISSS
jgi:hypothetical protein